jgi:hypothetical protein
MAFGEVKLLVAVACYLENQEQKKAMDLSTKSKVRNDD